MIDLPLNAAPPLNMYVDLNACFASVEQQANRLLRGLPVGVVANMHSTATIIAASYEAKQAGVETGDRAFIGKAKAPNLQIVQSDPDKYFYAHKLFADIFNDYSPDVVPLSIDEVVINFAGMPKINTARLIEIGYEIKERIKNEIGEWLTCNVGISTNRFLAKLAASLHKPDGLDVIDSANLEAVYKSIDLLDLNGINTRYKYRLLQNGINTPFEFLHSPLWQLKNQVFKSVVGYYWYLRLRGYEVDTVAPARRSYGQGYHLHRFTAKTGELAPLMMKLCEKMGRRLRRAGKVASGVQVFCSFKQGGWQMGRKFGGGLYTSTELYGRAMQLLARRPQGLEVTQLGVACFGLSELKNATLPLLDMGKSKAMAAIDAADAINDKYGEYVLYPALMYGLDEEIVKRVPFHATADTLAEIYEEADR